MGKIIDRVFRILKNNWNFPCDWAVGSMVAGAFLSLMGSSNGWVYTTMSLVYFVGFVILKWNRIDG